MKADSNKIFKGIRFRTWLIFTVFASVILLVLWVLQLNLITPYYRNAKINSVQSIADNIEQMIINNEPLYLAEQLARDNAMCLSVVDVHGNTTDFNGIGSSCYVTYSNDFNLQEFSATIFDSPNLESNYFIDYGGEMIVFGRLVSPHLGNFILLINAKITPEPAGLALIQNQFVFLTIIVLLFATGASLLIARSYSRPFITLTNSARKLAEGDLNVTFEHHEDTYNEVNELADSLNYATDKLKKIDQLRLDLIANVSHDIKTPLTMIMAYSEMISDFSKDDEKLLLEHLDVIRSEAHYLDTLVEDILELSILQSGNIKLNMSVFSLEELLNDVTAHFNFNIKISMDAQYDVEADEMKITQVLYNLVNNAIKHSKGDLITLQARSYEKNVLISVIDNGEGIEEKNLDSIWDRYYKIDKNFHRDFNSTGLGLSIAKGILDAHNQVSGVNSMLNKGSEFYFTLNVVKKF